MHYIHWLVAQSMLAQGKRYATRYKGSGLQWRRAYGKSNPRGASELASVWFTAYPPSIITRPGETVLKTLADPALWEAFDALGVHGMHTGPMKRAGGVQGRAFTPSVDGHFDRIGHEIDSSFGTTEQYQALVQNAAAHNSVIIGDIIPGHTGKGPDFRLAERNVEDYPGIYHMVAIDREDWDLLPPVPPDADAVNLSPETVDRLAEKGYIVGRLPRVMFYEPGVKETNWSATPVVQGMDRVERRWVYLHYFKAGQPTLNWLDPSFAAAQLVIGDALHSLDVLGERILRLDANGFLGIEPTPGGPAWAEGHPLSITANQLIASMVRKVGGFTFQELNLTVDDIAAMSNGGADLSYDFITRPAYHHALVSGDVEFLRLMLHTMHQAGIDPAGLIHALQNHDELTLELVHFWWKHAGDLYSFQGEELRGSELRERIRDFMYGRLTGDAAPYNRRFVTNGVASTTASVAAAALGMRDVSNLSPAQVQAIQQAHLLLAMFNAWQPGVFALSGWDMVGALPLPADTVADRLADGDTRWIHRGAYDLMGVNPQAERSPSGLPRAQALYGSIPEQMSRPDSFLARLQKLLAVRAEHSLHAARQLEVPEVRSPGLLVLVHALPEEAGLQVTALNFGPTPVHEDVVIAPARPGPVHDMLTGARLGSVSRGKTLTLRLAPRSGMGLLLGG